jgi:hypothetical protein
LAGHEIAFELARAGIPAAAHRFLAAGNRVNTQSPPRCSAQIIVESSRHAVFDDIDGA